MPLTGEEEFPQNTSSQTLGELIESVALHIGKSNSSALKPRIRGAILNSIRKMNRRRWNFTRAFDVITLKQDTPNYPLQGNVNKTYACTVMQATDSNEIEYRVRYVDYRTFLYQYRISASPTKPYVYTHRSLYADGEIIFYPKPSPQYFDRLVRVHYSKMIPLPAKEGEYLEIPSWAEGVIYWSAVAELHISVNQNVELYTAARREERAAFIEARGADYEESDDNQI